MKIILIFLFYTVGMFASNNIPFGIKDLCSPKIDEEKFSACFSDENKLKWISYQFENYDLIHDGKNKDINNRLKIKEETGLDVLELMSYKKNKYSFLTSELNFKNFDTIRDFISTIKNNKPINIIEGLVYSENDIKFKIGKEYIYNPTHYFIIITDISSRNIEKIFLLELQKFNLLETDLNTIRNLSNTNFLIKI